MSAPFETSPLAHRDPLAAGEAVQIRERAHLGLMILRGEPTSVDAPFTATTGIALPAQVRATAKGQDLAVCWLGPNEWLLTTTETAQPLLERLATALDETHHQLVDVSDAYTTIEIGGRLVRELLAKLITIDLHARAFRDGDAVATTLAKANVWLWSAPNDAGTPVFRVVVRRSHADYVWCLLVDAGREWGLPAAEPIGRVPLHLP